MPKTTNKIGGYVGTFSLMLAILAYLPSIAPFTPTIIGSLIAFFGDSYFDIYRFPGNL